jgi:DNA-directed RNA polymerase specialized sigma24 family protein
MDNVLKQVVSQTRETISQERLCYTVKQAAFALNISEKSVRRLLERGILKSSYALRKKLIPRKYLEEFFNATT